MLGDKRKANRKKTRHSRSPARKDKIMHGRLVWKTTDSTNSTTNERLHDFFKMQTDIEDGYSKTEMAFIMHGEELNWDHKLRRDGYLDLDEKEKAWFEYKFKSRVSRAFSMFRKWLENESLILIDEKTLDGEIIFYNVQRKKSINDWVRKRKHKEEGDRNVRERVELLSETPIKIRREKAEELSREIQLRNKRRNKSKYGDYGYA